MSLLNKEEKKTIKNALFHAFNAHGLISPVNHENTEQAGKGNESTGITLPAEFSNPGKFIKKETKTVNLVSNYRPDNNRTYAKVAFKKPSKKKNR